MLFCCSGFFALSNWLKLVVKSGSPYGIILKIAVSTGLVNLACYGETAEDSETCVFLSVENGDSVVLVILTAVFLSHTVEFQLDISRLAASVNFSTGVTVPVVCHSDG